MIHPINLTEKPVFVSRDTYLEGEVRLEWVSGEAGGGGYGELRYGVRLAFSETICRSDMPGVIMYFGLTRQIKSVDDLKDIVFLSDPRPS
jgi:hypothetical protein